MPRWTLSWSAGSASLCPVKYVLSFGGETGFHLDIQCYFGGGVRPCPGVPRTDSLRSNIWLFIRLYMGCDGQAGDSKADLLWFFVAERMHDISDEKIICYLRTLYLILSSSCHFVSFYACCSFPEIWDQFLVCVVVSSSELLVLPYVTPWETGSGTRGSCHNSDLSVWMCFWANVSEFHRGGGLRRKQSKASHFKKRDAFGEPEKRVWRVAQDGNLFTW